MIASSTYAPAMNGQAVFTTNLAEGLVYRGHKVLVILDSHQGNASHTFINGVEIHELHSISLSTFHAGVYFSPFPGSEIRHVLETLQPEIIHIQDHYPVCRSVVHHAVKRGIRIIGSNHFIPENLAPYIPGLSKIKPVFNWILWHWMLDVYKHVDVISAQSNAAVKLIQRQGLHMPILPISCGIDLHHFHIDPKVDRQMYRERFGIDPYKIIFLFLGRIDGEKRIDLLIRAMQQLPRDDVQLVIAGHGRVEKSLHRMAADMLIEQKVSFAGFIPAEDVPGLMNSVDVFVIPSEAELLSISTLEAMACGRPVLLTNALALPELVRHDENGYLFKPGDVKDLVCLMNVLADQPERWESMGKVSREITLSHNLDDTIQKFELVYAQLAAQGLVSEEKLGVRPPA
jgi:glycosyltransferase involved in cell wall biosynthesis